MLLLTIFLVIRLAACYATFTLSLQDIFPCAPWLKVCFHQLKVTQLLILLEHFCYRNWLFQSITWLMSSKVVSIVALYTLQQILI